MATILTIITLFTVSVCMAGLIPMRPGDINQGESTNAAVNQPLNDDTFLDIFGQQSPDGDPFMSQSASADVAADAEDDAVRGGAGDQLQIGLGDTGTNADDPRLALIRRKRQLVATSAPGKGKGKGSPAPKKEPVIVHFGPVTKAKGKDKEKAKAPPTTPQPATSPAPQGPHVKVWNKDVGLAGKTSPTQEAQVAKIRTQEAEKPTLPGSTMRSQEAHMAKIRVQHVPPPHPPFYYLEMEKNSRKPTIATNPIHPAVVQFLDRQLEKAKSKAKVPSVIPASTTKAPKTVKSETVFKADGKPKIKPPSSKEPTVKPKVQKVVVNAQGNPKTKIIVKGAGATKAPVRAKETIVHVHPPGQP